MQYVGTAKSTLQQIVSKRGIFASYEMMREKNVPASNILQGALRLVSLPLFGGGAIGCCFSSRVPKYSIVGHFICSLEFKAITSSLNISIFRGIDTSNNHSFNLCLVYLHSSITSVSISHRLSWIKNRSVSTTIKGSLPAV